MNSKKKTVKMVAGVRAVWKDGVEVSVTARRFYTGVYVSVLERGITVNQLTSTSVNSWNRRVRRKVREMKESGATVSITEKQVLPCGVMEDEDQARGDEDE